MMYNQQSSTPLSSASRSSIGSARNGIVTPGTSSIRPVYYPDDGEVPGTSGVTSRPSAPQRDVSDDDDDWYLEASYSSSESTITSSRSRNDADYAFSLEESSNGFYQPVESVSSASGLQMFQKFLHQLGDSKRSSKSANLRNHDLTNKELDRELSKQGFWMRHPENKNDEVLITSPSHYYLVYGSRSQVSVCSNQTALEMLYYFQSNAQGDYDVFEKPILGDTSSSPWQQRLELQNRCIQQNKITDETKSINSRNATVDAQARVATWLDKVQPELDITSQVVYSSRSDTELCATNRKRRRVTSEISERVPKRVKSETNVGEARPIIKRKNAKVGRCGSRRF